jgi:hypothetical protein
MVKAGYFFSIAGLALSIWGGLWWLFWYAHRHNRHGHFFFDPQDTFRNNPNPADRKLPLSAKSAVFEPTLKHYLEVTQLLVTVAAASIAFGGDHSAGHPAVNTAKLLLAWSILYGVTFCALLLWRYDEYSQDMASYTLRWYSTIFSSGFSSLVCFVLGYLLWGVALL